LSPTAVRIEPDGADRTPATARIEGGGVDRGWRRRESTEDKGHSPQINLHRRGPLEEELDGQLFSFLVQAREPNKLARGTRRAELSYVPSSVVLRGKPSQLITLTSQFEPSRAWLDIHLPAAQPGWANVA